MASSSSAKKVARVAAKSGSGSNAAKQANWLFPLAIVAVVALGAGIVFFARSENGGGGDNNTKPRAQLQDGEAFDHWHAAFSVNVCGKEQPAVQDGAQDPMGIHTHGDNLVHIHPFSIRASGSRARMKVFFDQVSLKVTDKGFELPDGKVYKEGETTCGGKKGQVVIAHWKQAVGSSKAKPDQIFTSDFGDIRFTENYGAYTLAFEPEGTKDIPPPSSSEEIKTLGACDGANPPPECSTGAGGATPVPTIPAGATDTAPTDSSGG
ncbi:MAG: hypothetical protein JWM47_815 [Acidimicrobiales bacterium]|nr:hypothetical protein [Acidimicrobiales bacterium]